MGEQMDKWTWSDWPLSRAWSGVVAAVGEPGAHIASKGAPRAHREMVVAWQLDAGIQAALGRFEDCPGGSEGSARSIGH